MQITSFQALTLLIEHKPHLLKDKHIAQLYICGCHDVPDQLMLDVLLEDEILSEYDIVETVEDTTEDEVRRFFESHLMLQYLLADIDSLDASLLSGFLNSLYACLSPKQFHDVTQYVFNNKKTKEMTELYGYEVPEYGACITELLKPGSYPVLVSDFDDETTTGKFRAQKLKERKQKIELIVKCSYIAMAFINNENYPLNIYDEEDSIYDPKNRGRIIKRGPSEAKYDEQVVRSQHLGIMKSYMPVPRFGFLDAGKPSLFKRCTDNCKPFNSGAWIKQHRFNRLSPFVTAISGTLLCQLRFIRHFLDKGTFVYKDNPKQCFLYFRTLISAMQYLNGGHCLFEFCGPLALPQVKKAFKQDASMNSITLQALFADDNNPNLIKAFQETLAYQQCVLAKKSAHQLML